MEDGNKNSPAINVKQLSKSFKLPHEQHSGLKQLLVNSWNRKSGYEIQQVLEDVSFEIKQGEFFGIVGRNGSGKSTLLKLLAGIYSPDKGDVQINGSLTPFIELGVGFNHELTGRENVYMNGALLGFSRKEMDQMYDDIVEFAELEKFMDQKLKNYSSGMQVRLAFSIAIRAKSDILLIDEVLAVGDSNFQKKCFDTFIKLKEEKRTIILVTHDMANVETFCDRALVLDKGKITFVGKPEKAALYYAGLNIEKKRNAKKKTEEAVNRYGDGGYTVGSLKINGVKANSAKPVVSGSDLDISFTVDSDGKFDSGYMVGLAIHNQHNVNILGPNSRKPFPNDTRVVAATIPKLTLAPGRYKLTVALFNPLQTKAYDFLDRYYEFEVISNHTVHGLVEFDSIWTGMK